MAGVRIREPVRPTANLACHVQVADGAISVQIIGVAQADTALNVVIDEFTQACELCCGVVLFDIRHCTIDGDLVIAVVREAVLRAGRSRCRVQVVVHDHEVAAALTQAGIAHTLRLGGVR